MTRPHTPLELLTDRDIGVPELFFREKNKMRKWRRKAQDKGSLSGSYRKLNLGLGQGEVTTARVIWSS